MSGYHNHYNDDSFHRGHINIDWQVQQAVEELRSKGEHVLAAAKNALKEGADIIVADMKHRTPVYKGRDKRPKKGLLRDSVKAEKLEDGAVYEFSANARNPYDNFLYGPIVEFSKWRRVRGKKVKARRKAFMYPAFEAHTSEVDRMVKNAIDAAITGGH